MTTPTPEETAPMRFTWICAQCKQDASPTIYVVRGRQLCYACVPSGTLFGWRKP